jgi:F0F1-type ATP synthase assembly protein I
MNNLDKKAPIIEKSSQSAGKIWWQEPLNIFSRLSGWVILPLIVGMLLGRWLDRRYSSEPKWFLIVIGIAFIISTIGLVIQAKSEFKKISSK